jgi:F-type H+-transporting ATPase subunit b
LEALGINLGFLVSQIVNFTLLVLLLYFVAYKPILRMIDERSARIKKGMEDAEEAARKAAQAEQEFEHRVAEARKESQEIIAQATQVSEQARQEILELARTEAQQLIAKAREEIGRERQQAMSELRQQVADLSVLMTERVLGDMLDESAQRRLIADFIAQAEELK